MIAEFFSKTGPLSEIVTDYRPRAAQIEMAIAVQTAIDEASVLVVEAGTGTGKTLAYLVPALSCGKKCIISTGSKTLQNQLAKKDLPLVQQFLPVAGAVTVLKGRNNYLCWHRLQFHLMESHGEYSDPTKLSQLVQLRQWASSNKVGDLSDCEWIEDESPIWSLVTSTNDNCLGKDCPDYDRCFVLKARKQAMNAQIVVVNHHVLLADIALKSDGFGELIPQAEVVILDEAHQLPELASQYFGERLSSRMLVSLAEDVLLAYQNDAPEVRQLVKCSDQLTQTALDFRYSLGDQVFRGNWREIVHRPDIISAFSRLVSALEFCQDVITMVGDRSALLTNASVRLTRMLALSQTLLRCETVGLSYWYECQGSQFVLHTTPLSISEKFEQYRTSFLSAWIFTSATLTIEDSFAHFLHRTGLESVKTLLLESPFDYSNQAMLCVPRNYYESHDPRLLAQQVTTLAPLIEKNGGRCFFLCTSHQKVKGLAQAFREVLSLPVLAQGEGAKSNLLSQYLSLGNALLIATGTFWEGIDVRGEALNCVIIDKLPFTAPDDPLLKARMEDSALRGGDPFIDVQLPDAVIALKQGVGRLIRDPSDRGVLIICDNRLVTRPYGATFLRSLPPLPRTRDLQKISIFLKSEDAFHSTVPQLEV